MDDQQRQIKDTRSVGTKLQGAGIVVALLGGFAALAAAVTVENFGVGFLGVGGALLAGLLVYGLGQVLIALAALLEMWSQGSE